MDDWQFHPASFLIHLSSVTERDCLHRGLFLPHCALRSYAVVLGTSQLLPCCAPRVTDQVRWGSPVIGVVPGGDSFDSGWASNLFCFIPPLRLCVSHSEKGKGSLPRFPSFSLLPRPLRFTPIRAFRSSKSISKIRRYGTLLL